MNEGEEEEEEKEEEEKKKKKRKKKKDKKARRENRKLVDSVNDSLTVTARHSTVTENTNVRTKCEKSLWMTASVQSRVETLKESGTRIFAFISVPHQ